MVVGEGHTVVGEGHTVVGEGHGEHELTEHPERQH